MQQLYDAIKDQSWTCIVERGILSLHSDSDSTLKISSDDELVKEVKEYPHHYELIMHDGIDVWDTFLELSRLAETPSASDEWDMYNDITHLHYGDIEPSVKDFYGRRYMYVQRRREQDKYMNAFYAEAESPLKDTPYSYACHIIHELGSSCIFWTIDMTNRAARLLSDIPEKYLPPYVTIDEHKMMRWNDNRGGKLILELSNIRRAAAPITWKDGYGCSLGNMFFHKA
jgi:hypothetical protein